MNDIANRINKDPLPKLSEKPGLTIPVNSLVGPSYQLSVEADDQLPVAEGPASESGDSRRSKGQSPPKIDIQLSDSNDESR